MPINDFSYQILEYINNAIRSSSVKPFNLGGITASGGGSGVPPGGFVGVLPQTRVAYDLSELSDDSIPVSGMSLLDNLNHIRYRVDVVESSASSIRTYTWVLGNPGIGGVPGPRLAETHYAYRVDSYVTTSGTVTFNIEERNTIGVAGTDLLASDLVSPVSGVYSDTIQNTTLVDGAWLWIDISDVSETPADLVITLACTVSGGS